MELLGTFECLILLAVLRLSPEAYGVSISDELNRVLEKKVSPGAIYTTLDRLERKGYLSSRIGDSSTGRAGRPKRFVEVTEQGRLAVIETQRAYRLMGVGIRLLEG